MNPIVRLHDEENEAISVGLLVLGGFCGHFYPFIVPFVSVSRDLVSILTSFRLNAQCVARSFNPSRNGEQPISPGEKFSEFV